ncbi:unnamed protein product [Kluyveromyces dobzhanskii CBS 2104]|uniref:WGS project CCBQ000000000 data, contig 00058 n=1 Tax=Kluyveromyces dobzhanskii CBS 2104 TaxID=1427455 RepID=A0A0A8LD48_9SACH|nr:unnamed protein product [Kluyveromyces dobzhanskii CBS 2104]
MFANNAIKVSRTLSRSIPSVATMASVSASATKATAAFNNGNSFKSFKEYREVATKYGPLSAKLAIQRQLAYPNGVPQC